MLPYCKEGVRNENSCNRIGGGARIFSAKCRDPGTGCHLCCIATDLGEVVRNKSNVTKPYYSYSYFIKHMPYNLADVLVASLELRNEKTCFELTKSKDLFPSQNRLTTKCHACGVSCVSNLTLICVLNRSRIPSSSVAMTAFVSQYATLTGFGA